jgi:hypothetical protein
MKRLPLMELPSQMFAPWRFRSPFEPSFATPALSRWRRTSRNGIVGGAAVGLLALDGPGYLLSEAAPALQERPMIDDDLPQPGRWMSDVRCIPMRWKSGFSRKMPTPTRRPSTPFGDELPAERQIERLKAASIPSPATAARPTPARGRRTRRSRWLVHQRLLSDTACWS